MASNIVIRELACKLTADELLQRGDAMADCEMVIDKLKDKRSKLSKKIGEKRKERFDLAEMIERGEETREVNCEWREDFAKNVKRLIRRDTGNEVEQVTMTAAERQLMIESPAPGRDETIDLDDVPDDDDDDDEDLDDDSDAAVEEPAPTPAPRKPRGRPRQQQPSV
jgi:hypothetical protein